MLKRTFLTLALLILPVLPAAALELVMFEAPGCVYCQKWHEEIGVAYPKTAEGQRAPLRQVSMRDARPDDLADLAPVAFSPTFVLVDSKGQELGRILGYPGEEFFWPMLSELLEKAPE